MNPIRPLIAQARTQARRNGHHPLPATITPSGNRAYLECADCRMPADVLVKPNLELGEAQVSGKMLSCLCRFSFRP